MPIRNVELSEHFEIFIDSGVASGRFSDASEAVKEGLRLLEQKEVDEDAKLAWLRSAAEEANAAFDRGEGILISSPNDIDALVNGAMDDMRSARSVGRG